MPFFILMRNDTKRKMGSLAFTAAIVFFGHWLDFFLMLKPGILHSAHAHLGHDAHGDHGHGDHGHGDHAHGAADHGHEAAGHGADAAFEMGFSFPGLIEVGTFIGFLCLFLYFFFSSLSRAKLVGTNDPYIEESIHHHA